MKWFNNMKVANKILYSCTIFLLIITGISLRSYTNNRDADTMFESFFTNKFLASTYLS